MSKHALREFFCYVDGSCRPHDNGAMGAGIVVIDSTGKRTERHVSLGSEGTNNEAELLAILEALKGLPCDPATATAHVFTDSQYAIDVLTGACRVRANADLVLEVRAVIRGFHGVRFHKVKGHVGHVANTRADRLADDAARRNGFHVVTANRRVGLGIETVVLGAAELGRDHPKASLARRAGAQVRYDLAYPGRPARGEQS